MSHAGVFSGKEPSWLKEKDRESDHSSTYSDAENVEIEDEEFYECFGYPPKPVNTDPKAVINELTAGISQIPVNKQSSASPQPNESLTDYDDDDETPPPTPPPTRTFDISLPEFPDDSSFEPSRGLLNAQLVYFHPGISPPPDMGANQSSPLGTVDPDAPIALDQEEKLRPKRAVRKYTISPQLDASFVKDAEKAAEWYIDEELIKDYEVLMTPQELEFRRARALKYKEAGNEAYKGSLWELAARNYTQALWLCPLDSTKDRAIMYANRGACLMKMNESRLAIIDCSRATDVVPEYTKPLMRRAVLFEQSGDLDRALGDYREVLKQEPDNTYVRGCCMRLEAEVERRNEEMKTKMMGQLKDLGNTFLRPFGLSTDSFVLEQQEGGGYTIGMKK